MLKKLKLVYDFIYLWVIVVLCSISNIGFAHYIPYDDDSSVVDIGQASKNVADALFSIMDLTLAVTTLGGVAFCCIAIAKLYQHKRNPQQVPISQFFITLVLGLVLLGLPFILKYGGSIYGML